MNSAAEPEKRNFINSILEFWKKIRELFGLLFFVIIIFVIYSPGIQLNCKDSVLKIFPSWAMAYYSHCELQPILDNVNVNSDLQYIKGKLGHPDSEIEEQFSQELIDQLSDDRQLYFKSIHNNEYQLEEINIDKTLVWKLEDYTFLVYASKGDKIQGYSIFGENVAQSFEFEFLATNFGSYDFEKGNYLSQSEASRRFARLPVSAQISRFCANRNLLHLYEGEGFEGKFISSPCQAIDDEHPSNAQLFFLHLVKKGDSEPRFTCRKKHA